MSIIHPRKYYAIPRVQRPDLEVNISVANWGKIKPIGLVALPLEIPAVGMLQQKC